MAIDTKSRRINIVHHWMAWNKIALAWRCTAPNTAPGRRNVGMPHCKVAVLVGHTDEKLFPCHGRHESSSDPGILLRPVWWFLRSTGRYPRRSLRHAQNPNLVFTSDLGFVIVSRQCQSRTLGERLLSRTRRYLRSWSMKPVHSFGGFSADWFDRLG